MNEDKQNTGLVAISNILARAKNTMNMTQKKLASIYLSKIEWSKSGNNNEIWVSREELIEKLGTEMDSSDISAWFRRVAKDMAHNSEIRFDSKDKSEWKDMFLFTDREYKNGKLLVVINPRIMKLLEDLKCEYITLFLADILGFPSNIDGARAFALYEFLRLHSDSRKKNKRVISTKEFKELFGIPKDGRGSYVRADGKFDRSKFEERVIMPVLILLLDCEHVILHSYDNGGALYKKIKNGNRVVGYELTYSINKHPNVVNQADLEDIQQRPEVLKVAKDILKGEWKKPKKNSYNDYPQRRYTAEEMDNLERIILQAEYGVSADPDMDGEQMTIFDIPDVVPDED